MQNPLEFKKPAYSPVFPRAFQHNVGSTASFRRTPVEEFPARVCEVAEEVTWSQPAYSAFLLLA